MNGIVFEIFSLAVVTTVFVCMVLGLFILWSYVLFEWIVRPAMMHMKTYRVFVDFIWHRKEFKKWRKTHLQEEDDEGESD